MPSSIPKRGFGAGVAPPQTAPPAPEKRLEMLPGRPIGAQTAGSRMQDVNQRTCTGRQTPPRPIQTEPPSSAGSSNQRQETQSMIRSHAQAPMPVGPASGHSVQHGVQEQFQHLAPFDAFPRSALASPFAGGLQQGPPGAGPSYGGYMGSPSPYGMYGNPTLPMYGNGSPAGGPQWLHSLHAAAGGASAVSELLLATSEVSARSAWALLALLERVGFGAARVLAFVRAKPPVDPRTGQPSMPVEAFRRHRKHLLVRWAAGLAVALAGIATVRWALSGPDGKKGSAVGGGGSRVGKWGRGLHRALWVSAALGAGVAAGFAVRGAMTRDEGGHSATEGEQGLPPALMRFLEALPGGRWLAGRVAGALRTASRAASVAVEAVLAAAGVDEEAPGEDIPAAGGGPGAGHAPGVGVPGSVGALAPEGVVSGAVEVGPGSMGGAGGGAMVRTGMPSSAFPSSGGNAVRGHAIALEGDQIGVRTGQARPVLWSLPGAAAEAGGSPAGSGGPVDQTDALHGGAPGAAGLAAIMGTGSPGAGSGLPGWQGSAEVFHHSVQGPGANPFS